MRFTVNKLLLIGLLGLVLCACSATDAEEGLENTTQDPVVEPVEAVEEIEETSIVADEMTTTFHPEVTKLRDLTEEDLEWYDIIMTRLNAIDDHSGDRETVYDIAEEYGEDPEELWFDWLEIVDAKWHGQNGDYAILTKAYNKLTDEIIEKNIVGENIEYISSEANSDEGNITVYATHQVRVDGKDYEISFVIEYKDDYKIAELIEFSVNGKIIDL